MEADRPTGRKDAAVGAAIVLPASLALERGQGGPARNKEIIILPG